MLKPSYLECKYNITACGCCLNCRQLRLVYDYVCTRPPVTHILQKSVKSCQPLALFIYFCFALEEDLRKCRVHTNRACWRGGRYTVHVFSTYMPVDVRP